MSRVPRDELERLKTEVSLQRLAESRGITLRPHGKNLIGLCPFHNDHEPSLVITPEKNLWNCLGACGTGGSVIDWVMKTEGVSFRHAVEILRTGTIPANATGKPPKVGSVRKLPPPVAFDAEDRELMKQVVAYYHQTLNESPEALDYLAKRGLKNSEMIDHFKLGYANRTLGLRLPERNRQAGAMIRERLIRLGILRDTGHEHFNGAITFPIFDEIGDITEIYGRKTCDKLTKGLAYHLYLPGPHKGLFNHEALRLSKEIILCEAIIDALTFWCAGSRNVTCSYGVNGFMPDHLDAFKKAGVERVFIAYDRDEAGDKAAATLADKLIGEGFECLRVLFPHGLDANAYALKVQPAEKSLALAIRNAVWIGKPVIPPNDAPPPSPSSLAAKEILPQVEPTIEIRDEEIIMHLNGRRWRIRGLNKNTSYDQLKVNLLISQGERFHVDTFDLYSARCRAVFIKQSCDELRLKEETVKIDLGRILLKLEELQDKNIKAVLEPSEKAVVLTDEERAEALEILQSPGLLNRILADFEKCGIVGEETNKLVGYLAAVSRKMENPLAVIIQSSSAAGKSSLMESVLAFIPEEDRVKYSAMTGQSLFYMGETNLKHKILAIVEEEGAERASYALKLLQSEGELTIASTGKDPSTGKLITHEYHVEGPVMIFVTTTSIEVDEELQNRCIVLTVNESREQTRAIHRLQRERRTLEGLVARREKNRLLKMHQNVQRLLEPVCVVNPYARHLTFLDDRTRTRRDHDKYLNLIEVIALLHQYQRPMKTGYENGKPFRYLEVTLEDIETANRFADEMLGRSLDELPPQSRRLLLLVERLVAEAGEKLQIERSMYRFSRREIREYTGFGNTQLKIHLHRLEELEYLVLHRADRGQGYVYELAYEGKGKDGKPFLHGLIDTAQLRQAYDSNRSGVNADRSGFSTDQAGRGRPAAPSKSEGARVEKKTEDELAASTSEDSPFKTRKHIDKPEIGPKDRHTVIYPTAAKEKGNGSHEVLK